MFYSFIIIFLHFLNSILNNLLNYQFQYLVLLFILIVLTALMFLLNFKIIKNVYHIFNKLFQINIKGLNLETLYNT